MPAAAKSPIESGHIGPRDRDTTMEKALTITLTPDQQRAVQGAIRAGLVRSADEFTERAIGTLPRREGEFDAEKGRQAVTRIRGLRKGVWLDRQGMSIRELAHIGHKY